MTNRLNGSFMTPFARSVVAITLGVLLILFAQVEIEERISRWHKPELITVN